jgi:hypothetical protein
MALPSFISKTYDFMLEYYFSTKSMGMGPNLNLSLF